MNNQEVMDELKDTFIGQSFARCEECARSEECVKKDLAKKNVWCMMFDMPVDRGWFCGDGERR